ncbi:MAG: hypothetical protein Ta2B_07910 [Termitinemataceae bacterium]|nr:MAG: hypothetical protein Ta2B_07910 [Termitinemataceae bacterium]
MKKYLLLELIVVLSIFSCAASPYTKNSAHAVPPDFFGITPYDGHKLIEKDYEVINDLGVVWMRRTFNWSRVERNQGEWDFSAFDDYVDDAKKQGKKLIAILAYDPSWKLNENGKEFYVSSKTLPLYIAYVEKIVERYKGKVDAWEIWNEPNNFFMGFWKGNVKEFSNLTKAAALKVKEVDPAAKIVAGSFFRSPSGFVKKMFKAGAFENVDAISFHPYSVSPAYTVKVFDKFEALLKKHKWEKEIFVSEVGFPTSGWYPSAININKYPSYIVKTLCGLSLRNTPFIIWYELFDEYNQGEEKSKSNSEDYFGIIYPDFSYKKGAAAYKLCSTLLAGSKYVPLNFDKQFPHSVTALFFTNEKDKSSSVFLWDEKAKRHITIKLPVRSGQTSSSEKIIAENYRVYNIETGTFEEKQIIDGIIKIDIGATPTVLQFHGTTEDILLSVTRQ